MSEGFLHERSDFKALINTVAENRSINDPALVEKDYWLMHTLYGLKTNGLNFELKGGTSLSKGFDIIHRFSEDIDIRIEPFDAEKVATNPNQDKPHQIESRRVFFEKLREKIRIPGITEVTRDTGFDDDEKLRNAALRLRYNSNFGSVAGLKDGILLEVGFDQTSPFLVMDITSWVVEFARTKNLKFTDNRALKVPCYNPEYTFVEKLQAITKKFRQFKESGNPPSNFLRHYYDIHQLLDDKRVQRFIGTKEYLEHKDKRFKSENKDIPKSEAFRLDDGPTRKRFEADYAKTATLYYRGQVPFADILRRIQKYVDRL